MVPIHFRILVILGLVVLMVFSSAVEATTYWVEPPPQGSDTNPGTSDQPWATLQHAADQVVAGDTIFVRTGDYVGAELMTSGTEGAQITFCASDGARPRIATMTYLLRWSGSPTCRPPQ